MSYSGVTVSEWGGLDLVSDPETVGWRGAIDLLNVDLDRRGRVRTRDGYDNFTTTALSGESYGALFYDVGTSSLLAGVAAESTGSVKAIGTDGVVDATSATFVEAFAAIGTTSASYVYGSSRNFGGIVRWDGTTFTTPAGVPSTGGFLAVQPRENRLVHAAHSTGGDGKVWFSDAGAPETFGTDNYVLLDPGDGESIRGMVVWRDLLFVFKKTKFYVFYGNSVDADGGPVFNYRTVNTGVGIATSGPAAFIAGRNAVYFLGARGVYATTGGPPVLISRAIEPLFTGASVPFFTGGSIDLASTQVRMGYADDRLYISAPVSGGSANSRTLVYDTRDDWWTVWDIGARGFATLTPSGASRDELLFSYGSGEHIGRIAPAYTTDDGTAITSRYRSGFADLGSPNIKRLRQTELWGTGTPSFAWSTDFGSLDTASSVTLGSGTNIAQGRHSTAKRGYLFSYSLSATSGQWTLNRLVPHLDGNQRPTGQKPT